MDAQTTYTTALGRSTDFLQLQQNAKVGLGYALAGILGGSTALQGLALTQTVVASLVLNLAPGSIYASAAVEATSWSGLSANTTEFTTKQGILHVIDPITFVPPGTIGFAQNFLVEVQYADLDTTPVVLNYFNAANPAVPFVGPAGNGLAQNTQRLGICAVQVKSAPAASAGTQTTPTPDAGWTGAYVVTVANGATALTSANIALYLPSALIPVSLPAVPSSVQNNMWTFGIAGGIADTFTFSLTPPPTAYSQGMGFLVNFPTANTTTTPTLNVNGLGAKTIVKLNGNAVGIGDIAGYIGLIYDGATLRLIGPAASDTAATTGRTFVASTSWTVPANIRTIRRIRCWGAGGGGGGTLGANSGGSGGAGGGYSEKINFPVTPGASITVTVGAIGAAGTVTPTNGGAGGASSFGAACAAGGGGGGFLGNGTLASSFNSPGAGSGGDINLTSTQGGGLPFIITSGYCSGLGGPSPFGGGTPSLNVGAVGAVGNFPGGGANGGSAGNAGGAGAAGFIIIEY